MKLDSLKLIGSWLNCPCEDHVVKGFAFDSREIEDGFLFFALRGQKFDGHDFLQDVGKKGAIAAVVDKTYRGETGGLILLYVDNVTEALQTLAREVQKRRHQRIIAVTGSVGKTTTKEFLFTLLSQKFSVAKTPGNSNSQVGLPLSILRGAGEEELFIMEMAMTEFGQLEKLVQIAPPEIAVITKVGYSHVDTITGGLEGIAAAKAEILRSPSTKWAVIEKGAFQFPVIQNTGTCKKITYSVYQDRLKNRYLGGAKASGFEDFPKGSIEKIQPEGKSSNPENFRASLNTDFSTDLGIAPASADMVLEPGWLLNYQENLSPTFRLPFSETHFCENFAGAATVAYLLGLSWEEILKGIRGLKSIKLRFEKIDREGVVIINDSYNASPESTKAALENLPKPAFGAKTIFVFGEMMTLGKFSEEGHKKVGEQALAVIDHLLCYGKRCMPMVELFSKAGKPVEFFRDIRQLKKTLFELSKPGDVVLIKGSNGNKLWELLQE